MAKVEYKRGKIENLNDKNVPIEDGSIIFGYSKDSNNAEMYVDIGDNRYPVNSVKVDQNYEPESKNAQSGIAVSEALGEFTNTMDFKAGVVDTVDAHGYITNAQAEIEIERATDQAYNPESKNAQSGIAVEQALNLYPDTPRFMSGVMGLVQINGYTPTDQIYDAASQNAQSGIAIAKVIDELTTLSSKNLKLLDDKINEKPGLKIPNAGEIFGSYEKNQATAKYSTAFGYNNKALDEGAFVCGSNNIAKKNCLIGGNNNTIMGISCFAFGIKNNISENAESCAIYGEENQILNGGRHLVFGTANIVQDTKNSQVFLGNLVGGKANTINSGNYNVILGENNIIDNGNKVAVFGTGHHLSSAKTWSNLLIAGRYSKLDSSRHLFVVGNGTSDSNRGNAFEVRSEVNGTGPYVIIGGETLYPSQIKEFKKINDKADTTYVDAEIKTLSDKLSSVYVYKGSVKDLDELRDIVNQQIGDVYNVGYNGETGANGENYAWTGEEWDSLGGIENLDGLFVSIPDFEEFQENTEDGLMTIDNQLSAHIDDPMAHHEVMQEMTYQYAETVVKTHNQDPHAHADLLAQYVTKDKLDNELYTMVEIPSEYINHFASEIEDYLAFTNNTYDINYIYDEGINIGIGWIYMNVPDITKVIDTNGASKLYIEFGEGNEYIYQITKAVIIKKKYSNTITTKYFNNEAWLDMTKDNYEYIASEPISKLYIDINYPNGPTTCSIIFTISNTDDYQINIEGNVKYIGGVPDFKPGETWELNIRNGIVVAGKVEEVY